MWNGDNPDAGSSSAPWKIYNIGSNSPIELLDYIKAIENALDIVSDKELLPMQPGDVPETYAEVKDLVKDFDYKPSMTINEGVGSFVKWYRSYYDV